MPSLVCCAERNGLLVGCFAKTSDVVLPADLQLQTLPLPRVVAGAFRPKRGGVVYVVTTRGRVCSLDLSSKQAIR